MLFLHFKLIKDKALINYFDVLILLLIFLGDALLNFYVKKNPLPYSVIHSAILITLIVVMSFLEKHFSQKKKAKWIAFIIAFLISIVASIIIDGFLKVKYGITN